MGRVFFPTYRANIIGVRDVGPQTQLGGMDGSIVIPRAPAEPYPRAANNPTQRMLGAAAMLTDGGGTSEMIRAPFPIDFWGGRIGPRYIPSYPVSPIVAAPGAPASAPPAPPPVSAQSSPTPVVTMSPSPQPGTILISSGGGTAAPSTAPITIQTGDTMSAVTAWLQGSTPIFSYTIPNVVLAGGVILLFAWLSSGSGKKR
jgi:hypothetical protein